MSPQKFNVQNLFCTMITHILTIKKRSLSFSKLKGHAENQGNHFEKKMVVPLIFTKQLG